MLNLRATDCTNGLIGNSLSLSLNSSSRDYEDTFDYMSFCRPYDPTLSMDGLVDFVGWTFSLLKKDGTWDVVAQSIDPYSTFQVDLSSVSFHYPDSIYARTTDNLLRGRVSNNVRNTYNNREFNDTRTTYYVLEYLPQKIEQNLAKIHEDSYQQDEYLRDVEIAMSNIEGATHIYVEQLEEGDYFPTTRLLSNNKLGRFLATVDKEYSSEFTIISYNNHGFVRSNVLTVDALEPADLNVCVEGGRINVTYGHKNKHVENCTYSVTSLSSFQSKKVPVASGNCKNGEVPISALNDGLNIIKVMHPNGKSKSVKIIKDSHENNKSILNLVI